jgi:ribosome-associated protein
MIPITEDISIAQWELSESFSRASGPGGQNVNKVETAVTLRFEAARSPNLPPEVKARLRRLAGRRWTADGAVVIQAESHRSQMRNREDALARLVELIQKAAVRPKKRVPTRPTLASKRRRLAAKTQRGGIKRLRGRPVEED